ncbi:ABC transporter permease [Chloroflexota bacterium]
MSKTLTVLKHEFLTTLKRKSFILITIAFPLLALLGYGIYTGVQHWYNPGVAEEENIGCVDYTGTFDEYTSQFGATIVLYPGEEEAREALFAEGIGEYFVIPQDYLYTGSIIRYTTEREMELPTETINRIHSFLLSNLLSGETSPEIVERVKMPILMTSLRLDDSGEVVADQNVFVQYFLPFVFAILFIMSIFFTSGYLLQSVSEEKENRLIEVLLSSVSARQLLMGKVLGLGAAGLIQIAIWLASVKVFAEVAQVNIPVLSELSVSPGLLALAFIYYILGYLLFASIYAGIGSVGSTARESQSWSGMLVIFGLIPVWFNFIIIANPEHVAARVLTFIPLTAPVTAMMRLPAGAIPPWEIALSIVILAGSVVFGIWAAAKVFRTCLLMYGKSPAFKEIIRYVREA